MKKLVIKDLEVYVGDRRIVKGVSLTVSPGEVYIVMGPNGSGKSTFANAIMGLSKYKIRGAIRFGEEDISKLKINERAKKGIFLAFQNPPEVDGVKNSTLVRQARLARGMRESAEQFKVAFEEILTTAGLDSSFYSRYVNCGFSGGEKKKNELAQLMALSPKFAVLDEIDSGLDVDSMKMAAKIVKEVAKKGTGIIFITHSPAIIKYIQPTKVYVFDGGRIVMEGGQEVVRKLERSGFATLKDNNVHNR